MRHRPNIFDITWPPVKVAWLTNARFDLLERLDACIADRQAPEQSLQAHSLHGLERHLIAGAPAW